MHRKVCLTNNKVILASMAFVHRLMLERVEEAQEARRSMIPAAVRVRRCTDWPRRRPYLRPLVVTGRRAMNVSASVSAVKPDDLRAKPRPVVSKDVLVGGKLEISFEGGPEVESEEKGDTGNEVANREDEFVFCEDEYDLEELM